MTLDRAKLLSNLMADEGIKAYVYDDATGHYIVPGSTVVGHPTIGIGWALDMTPMKPAWRDMIANDIITDKDAELCQRFPWVVDLPEPAHRALVDMAFNLGVQGLSGFITFLRLMQSGQYAEAAGDLAVTRWASQVGDRATRVGNLIRSAAMDAA